MSEPGASARTRIWDLPTRLFHWLLAALVVFSFTTGKLGGDWLTWHFRSGYAIASLLLFRLLWGFAGSRYARFASFLAVTVSPMAHGALTGVGRSAGECRAQRSRNAIGVCTADRAGHTSLHRRV